MSPPGVHLHIESFESVKEGVARGDDYFLAALRYGKLVYDRHNRWYELARLGHSAPWPKWTSKLDHARRRLRIADDLLETGDSAAAAEEYLTSATQLARGVLLRLGVFPLSRPELADQLSNAGHQRLASSLRSLLADGESTEHLAPVSNELRALLEQQHAEPPARHEAIPDGPKRPNDDQDAG